ncbi:FAD/NAD(P)-binding domain-containing protein [Myriangium duriaei CBS 260.36]|uniref:FAD/NAD(P)-binding domain-containing protein n=1 Tax=Myriangium duriaei CBS 260.36 TaxID=1168546 RepID=A0A9P4J0H1_9PEZI|nr:FAD/NAD(P)-binding domain-containing protein [Myriangium duriaei CBS 260.36]
MSTLEVAIIGAGPTGLATAAALRKYLPPSTTLHLTIYERLSSTLPPPTTSGNANQTIHPTVGAGLALQSNGVAVLHSLSPRLGAAVEAGGMPCVGFKFRTASNWLLGRSEQGLVAVERGVMVAALMEGFEGNVVRKGVERVEVRRGERPRVWVQGEGEGREVDLVVGADGIRSVARVGLWGRERFGADYTGQCAVGGIYKMPVPKELLDDPVITFAMGATGSMGYCGLSQADTEKMLWWSVYATDLPARGKDLDVKDINRQIQLRHGDWKVPILQRILRDGMSDNVWPIFTVPDMPYWGRDGVVLVGDAAHAMAPRTGQGSSQGLEDAQTLGVLVGELMGRGKSTQAAVKEAIEGLYTLRHDRVKGIIDRAERFKEKPTPMTKFQTLFLYTIIFVMTKLEAVSRMFKFFKGAEDWDAETVVRDYLKKVE